MRDKKEDAAKSLKYYWEHHEECLKRQRARQAALKHPCPTCGVPISASAKYCRKHSPHHPKGEKNPNWKGGRTKGGGGYIKVLKPEHPRADKRDGYVAEHILVWEEAHGKLLPDGWVVHHLNGIKDDNRPSNLVALPNMKHNLVLQAKTKRIQELEAKLNNQHQLL